MDSEMLRFNTWIDSTKIESKTTAGLNLEIKAKSDNWKTLRGEARETKYFALRWV